MKLPAIETPDAADVTTAAREWAFRLATLPFTATVDDVAMLVQAAMDDAVKCANAQKSGEHDHG